MSKIYKKLEDETYINNKDAYEYINSPLLYYFFKLKKSLF